MDVTKFMQMHIFVNDCAQESSTQTKFMAQHEAHEASLRSLRSALQVEVEAASGRDHSDEQEPAADGYCLDQLAAGELANSPRRGV